MQAPVRPQVPLVANRQVENAEQVLVFVDYFPVPDGGLAVFEVIQDLRKEG